MTEQQRKAMKMALDFIVVSSAKDKAWYTTEEFELVSALRQALAQPVDAVNMSQERVDETVKNRHEPVAWRNTETGEFCTGGFLRKDLAKWTALYTAPPKREWVGLSSLDKTFLRTAYAQLRPLYHDKKEDVSVAAEVVTDWDGFFAAINDMLKEKNIG